MHCPIKLTDYCSVVNFGCTISLAMVYSHKHAMNKVKESSRLVNLSLTIYYNINIILLPFKYSTGATIMNISTIFV